MIHATSVAVSREHRRAKTDRLDTGLLKRAFLGWLRGERGHCSMAAIPTPRGGGCQAAKPRAREPGRRAHAHRQPDEERSGPAGHSRLQADLAQGGRSGSSTLRTPEGTPLPPNTLAELHRDMARLRLINDQIAEIEDDAPERLRAAARHRLPSNGAAAGACYRHRDRDRRHAGSGNAVAKIARSQRRGPLGGLTGSPDESGARRREKGLARAGNARVRRGMIQLAWRFLMFQKDSALAQWYRARTADARGATRKTMIVALARKLLIALWRLVTTGEVPHGVVLRPRSTREV